MRCPCRDPISTTEYELLCDLFIVCVELKDNNISVVCKLGLGHIDVYTPLESYFTCPGASQKLLYD